MTMDFHGHKWLTTVLVNAAERGNIEVVKKFLQEVPELDINATCHQYEQMALNAAIISLVRKQMAAESQSYGNYNWKIQPQFGVIEQLVKYNVNLNEKFPTPQNNALISAIDCRQIDVTRSMITWGVNINRQGSYGLMPLVSAA